jgi:ribonuclease HI
MPKRNLSVVCNPTKVGMFQLLKELAVEENTSMINTLYANTLWRNIRFYLADTETLPVEVRSCVDYGALLHQMGIIDPQHFLDIEAQVGGLVEELITKEILAALSEVRNGTPHVENCRDKTLGLESDMHVGMFDGGAAPKNPGPCGSGWVLYHNKNPVSAGTVYTPHGTNNEAEYYGLLGLMKELESKGIERANIIGDSLLVINQMTGVYACKALNLRPLLSEAQAIAETRPGWTFLHVRREKNKVADALCEVARKKKKSETGPLHHFI